MDSGNTAIKRAGTGKDDSDLESVEMASIGPPTAASRVSSIETVGASQLMMGVGGVSQVNTDTFMATIPEHAEEESKRSLYPSREPSSA